MFAPIPEDVDLRRLRESAKLTQTDLANRIGASQSQVQRWEANPDGVPLRVLRDWIAVCGKPATEQPLNVGAPYTVIGERLTLLRGYQCNQPELLPGDTIASAIGLEDLITAVQELGRKPRVVFSGPFDAGKSRLANTLLGKNDWLPTAYQPTTRVVCLIRHVDDKPEWQRESVWIMDNDFKLGDATNKDACQPHRLLAGESETLRHFGTHAATRVDDAGTALIYLDAPILKACDLIDAPGFGHENDEDALARSIWSYGDVVVYLSPFVGFMNAHDVQAISALLETLPVQPGQEALRGFAVLATHAHPGIADAELEQALTSGAERLHQGLRPLFERRAGGGAVAPDAMTLRRRFFPWYVDTAARRAAFEADLTALLGSLMPQAVRIRLDSAVAAFRDQARNFYRREAGQLQGLLNARTVAASQMRDLLREEGAVRARVAAREKRVLQIIAAAKAATQGFLDEKIKPLLTAPALEMRIAQNFTNREEAGKKAGALILSELRGELEMFIHQQAAPLSDEVEGLLLEYALDGERAPTLAGVPFDARAAFMGGAAGVGTFGALAGWAAIVAGGSNLGAWLLVPQVISLLSSLGISFAGGTAAGVSLVATIGGPVTIGVAIAGAIGVLAWQVFGRSWQARLARQLADQLVKDDLFGKIQQKCNEFWDGTERAFRAGLAETVRKRAEHMERLQRQIEIPEHALQARLTRLDARLAFLTYLPWTPLSGDS